MNHYIWTSPTAFVAYIEIFILSVLFAFLIYKRFIRLPQKKNVRRRCALLLVFDYLNLVKTRLYMRNGAVF